MSASLEFGWCPWPGCWRASRRRDPSPGRRRRPGSSCGCRAAPRVLGHQLVGLEEHLAGVEVDDVGDEEGALQVLRPTSKARVWPVSSLPIFWSSLMPAKIGTPRGGRGSDGPSPLGIEDLGGDVQGELAAALGGRGRSACRTGEGSLRRSPGRGRAGRPCRGTCACGRCARRARSSGRTRTPPSEPRYGMIFERKERGPSLVKKTPGERWSCETMTRSVPLMMKVPLSVISGMSPKKTSSSLASRICARRCPDPCRRRRGGR